MAKILLISPPFYRLMGSHYNGIHLGLSYIAAILQKHDHEVRIYNADFLDDRSYLNQKEIIENFDLYRTILDDLNHPIFVEVFETIKKVNPEFIGIQVYTGTFKSAQNIAAIAKQFNPQIKIIVGGAHPTLDPRGTIRYKHYDYVVRGEGEYTFLDIVNGKNPTEIKNLTFKKGNEIFENDNGVYIDNLDSLPFPSRNLFLHENGMIDIAAVITSRGCPYECRYCASPRLWQKKTRFRSVENVLEELEYIKENYNYRYLRFQDDTFTINKKRVKKILHEMIKRKLNFKWICDTRIDTLDKDLLELMKESGCIRIKVGVESGSDRILKHIKKGITVAYTRKIINLIKETGIPLTIYLMIGFPSETDEDVKKTIKLAKEIQAEYNSLSVFSPYYGTDLYDEFISKGFHHEKAHWEFFFHQSKQMIMNLNISPALIKEFFDLNETGKGQRI